MHQRLLDVFSDDRPLRGSQARHLSAVQDGGDAILIGATGSGKSYTMFAPSIADALELRRTGGGRLDTCHPIDLVLIPMANMGDGHKESYDCIVASLLAAQVAACVDDDVARDGGEPPCAYYVERGGFAAPSSGSSPSGLPAASPGTRPQCPQGHHLVYAVSKSRWKLATLDTLVCEVKKCDIGPRDGRWSCAMCDYDVCESCMLLQTPAASTPPFPAPWAAAASPRVLPVAFPCGLCPPCTGDPTFPQHRRASLPHGCAFSCKLWCTEHRERCRACRSPKGSLKECALRKQMRPPGEQAGGVVDDVARDATPRSGASVPDSVHTPQPQEPGPIAGAAPPAPPKRLEDLPELSPERIVADAAPVRLVICTVSALHDDGDGGRLLNEALARRGVRRVLIDELHTISTHYHAASMATFSEALASISELLDNLCAQLRRHQHPRPQIMGFTSTMPVAAVSHVRERARVSSTARVVRCAIDRPELQFVRLPLPARIGEAFVHWGQRVLDHLGCSAPLWALAGRLVIFCPGARSARRAMHQVRVRCPDGTMRPNFVFLGVAKMSTSSRAAAVDRFGRSVGGILFTNEAWSHGSGRPNITMVVHLALAKGPVENFQRSGRGAREVGESALVVHVPSVRSVSQYLQVINSPHNNPLVGVNFLVEQLATDGCLRATFLAFLGQSFLVRPCSGCDSCARTFGPPADGPSLGRLPHDVRWCPAGDAAASLFLRWPENPTIGSLLRAVSSDAPAPFHQYDAHDGLVWALIAEKTIRLEVHTVDTEGGVRCYALCSLDAERADDYSNQRRSLDVPLLLQPPAEAASPPTVAPALSNNPVRSSPAAQAPSTAPDPAANRGPAPPPRSKRPASPHSERGGEASAQAAPETVALTPGEAHAADRTAGGEDEEVDRVDGVAGSAAKRRGVIAPRSLGSWGDESDVDPEECGEWDGPGSDEEQMERELMPW